VGQGEVVLATGGVSPSTVGPFVEQVGQGVARQVARLLAPSGPGDEALLGRLSEPAEADGFATYAVFEGRTAVALALVRLGNGRAIYVGDVVTAAAPPGTRAALLVRALHDAAAAGIDRLVVPSSPLDLGCFAQVHGH
jgi:hypothetical protein